MTVVGFLLVCFWLILRIEKRRFILFHVLVRDSTLCSHKGKTTIESTSRILRNTSEGNVLQVRCVAVTSLLFIVYGSYKTGLTKRFLYQHVKNAYGTKILIVVNQLKQQ